MRVDRLGEAGELTAGIAEVLLAAEQIQERVSELGAAISRDYAGREPLLVGVLKGVTLFMADLLRAISIPVELDFIAVASFSAESRRQGMVRLEKDLGAPIAGRHVLFVEDVIDTGLTLNYLLRSLQAREPASLEVCALLNKSGRRFLPVAVKYVGFELGAEFVVGYGLDYRERYRNLPFIGLLGEEALSPDKTRGPK
ncbi:MAG: hypoxanthine phosphoribosyltransferase [Candidatus Promineifilaceae bacterium]